MIVAVDHRLAYAYARPVVLGPHVLRLAPRTGAGQRLLDFRLAISPAPVKRTPALDPEGNEVLYLWFEGETRELAVRARSRVETAGADPFDYWAFPGADDLPPRPAPAAAHALTPALSGPSSGPRTASLADTAAREAGGRAGPFLLSLAREIHRAVATVPRETGAPRDPEETLARSEGACRDLAVLFMAACRRRGLAARFVSGYLANGETSELHAWAEVFIDGGGWRGYDPSCGLAVDDRYIPVAAAADPADAAPLAGSYGGEPTEVRLTHAVALATEPRPIEGQNNRGRSFPWGKVPREGG